LGLKKEKVVHTADMGTQAEQVNGKTGRWSNFRRPKQARCLTKAAGFHRNREEKGRADCVRIHRREKRLSLFLSKIKPGGKSGISPRSERGEATLKGQKKLKNFKGLHVGKKLVANPRDKPTHYPKVKAVLEEKKEGNYPSRRSRKSKESIVKT